MRIEANRCATGSSILDPQPLASHTLFISDLHLSAANKQSAQLFFDFIATQASQAEALYILGDLFEYWAGDDDLHTPFHRQVTRTLSTLTAHGTRLFLMRGNRDLLIGKAYAAACGAVLLDDPTLIALYGIPTLLCHGDTLCTDDVEYQNFRKHVHSTSFQNDFLSRPLDARKAHIEQLRKHSDAEKQRKNSEIMDVNSNAVATLLREYHYPRLIHGHTHRPNRHEFIVDQHTCVRWVLGDWDTSANALRVDANNSRWVAFPK